MARLFLHFELPGRTISKRAKITKWCRRTPFPYGALIIQQKSETTPLPPRLAHPPTRVPTIQSTLTHNRSKYTTTVIYHLQPIHVGPQPTQRSGSGIKPVLRIKKNRGRDYKSVLFFVHYICMFPASKRGTQNAVSSGVTFSKKCAVWSWNGGRYAAGLRVVYGTSHTQSNANKQHRALGGRKKKKREKSP